MCKTIKRRSLKGRSPSSIWSIKGFVKIGDSELSLWGNFPDISIKVYDVQIFETKEDGAPLIMDVKDIYIGFNLWDIVNGNYDIQSILVEDGVFNLVIHENNTTNIQLALEAPTPADSTTTNIHLKKIKFKNLDVHTLDEATNTDVEKFIYSGQGGFIQKDSIIAGHIDTELELNVIKDGDTTFIRKKHFELHTDVSYNEDTGILDIEPSGIVMENGDFELVGSIDILNDVDLDLTITGTKPNFDMLIAFAPADVIPVFGALQQRWGNLLFRDHRRSGQFRKQTFYQCGIWSWEGLFREQGE
ncbi:hypothetical protein [Gilvibacter sp.]|uniref:hypothetical protein n=1 Tax=Gilvibacter sp. TaxID=2729997 RepID=UPI003F4A3472